MRFTADGPSIPDDLLLARDQGRVVFFCGAGVSRAKVNLPDFFGLAEAVAKNLGLQADSPAMKIISEAKELEKKTRVGGLISADRIFGLLERDFLQNDIQTEVAKTLSVAGSPDLTAHKILLKLAKTREGLIRLVTTNFDRLFDLCRPELPTFIPPNLPDPSRPTEFHGIINLHGKIDSSGSGAEGEGFILSSSEFGEAYLSDGWATSFFREILDKYFVVFIGYTADDPPVNYLLEALNRAPGSVEGMYAFQGGDANYAKSRWDHKGVKAIAYDNNGSHDALWETLAAWADRAENPDTWVSKLVKIAKSGPENLVPHERGQIAHIVSTVEGVRKFSEGDNPPPATWLCVFDPIRRFAKPGDQGTFSERGPYIDPFDFYSLDSDPVPEKIVPDDYYAKREVPSGCWDAFAINKQDRNRLVDENISALRGYRAKQMPCLSDRLCELGIWISKVASQPEAVWWAAHQSSLHPFVQDRIIWQLERAGEKKALPKILGAWRYLFDCWAQDQDENQGHWYTLKSEIDVSGWNKMVFRRFQNYTKPTLNVTNDFWKGPVPNIKENYELSDLFRREVYYPPLPKDITIPDEWLNSAVVTLRRNLETALELEEETGGYNLQNVCPIAPDNDPHIDLYSRSHGLSGWVLYFISQFERLMNLDINAARTEFSKWNTKDPTIFSRLRIWALGQSKLVSEAEFTSIVKDIPDDAFWHSSHTRDLLLALSSRWNELKIGVRDELEQRILEGDQRWIDEESDEYKERKAWASLNRLNWLHEQGYHLKLNLRKVNEKLRKEAPNWKPEYAKHAAVSLEGRGGTVRTDTDHKALLREPLKTTLAKARKLSGRNSSDFVTYDPFSGLAKERPVRAFAALRLEAKGQGFPVWAWQRFLESHAREDDQEKFTAFVAEQITRYPVTELAKILHPVSIWVQKTAKILSDQYPTVFYKLISKIIEVLKLQTSESATALSRSNKHPDWTMEAINSPAGKITEALFDDRTIQNLGKGKNFPAEWIERIEALLVLPSNFHRQALVICTRYLSWFFAIDPTWTQTNLLSVLDADEPQDIDAFWSGFLQGGQVGEYRLFVNLKPHLLRLGKSNKLKYLGYQKTLASMLLSAWGLDEKDSGKRWISNNELRDFLLHADNDLLSSVLWQADRWSKEEGGKWRPLLIKLLSNVWPRQISVKSGKVSVRLCEIIFSEEESFPELAKVAFPLLTNIDSDHSFPLNLLKPNNNIVDLYPKETLSILYAILPENVSRWPYGIEDVITRICDADNTLSNDERLIKLKQKWDAR